MTESGAEPVSTEDRRCMAAADWFALRALHDIDGEDGAFREWLNEAPENRLAYVRAETIWQDLDRVIPRRDIVKSAEIVSLAPRRRSGLAIISGLAVAASLALAVMVAPILRERASPQFETSVGEQRTVLLSDQSKVTLNTDTSVVVDYDDAGRRVKLERGEALFEVARDTARPFVVHVGDNEVRAVGTAFIVRRDAGRVLVTLLHGKVAVTDGDEGGKAFMLSPGERAVLAGEAGITRDRPQLDTVTAWRRGEMILHDTSVNDAVREINRYSGQRIEVASPRVASQKLTGVFKLSQSREFANTLSALYNLEVDADREHLVLRERKKN